MNVFVEVMGYVGMAIVLISFLMKEIVWVRIINIVGSSLCFTYGIMTSTIPTAGLNGSLVVINSAFLIVYFVKKHKAKTNPPQVEEKEKSE